MTISDFLSICDDFCRRKGVSRTWLSKRLFSDTYRLQNLDAGESDVGVRRMAQAVSDLRQLDAATPDTVDSAANDDARPEKAA